MKQRLNIILLAIAFVFGCNDKPQVFKFSNYSIAEIKYPLPSDTIHGCSFSASIPILESGNPVLIDSINFFIANTYFTKSAKSSLSLKERVKIEADSFYKAYLNDFAAFGETNFPLSYEYDLKLTIAFFNEQYVTLKSDNYDYMGGAHGNYSTLYYMFDAKTGKRIQLSALVSDTSKLNSIAKQMFYKQKQIDTTKTLNDQGYWFEKNKFALNDNFGLLNDTLVFTFNPYEITSYSEGQTDIKIPLHVIK